MMLSDLTKLFWAWCTYASFRLYFGPGAAFGYVTCEPESRRTSERTNLTDYEVGNELNPRIDRSEIFLVERCAVKMFTSFRAGDSFDDATVPNEICGSIKLPPLDTPYHVATGSKIKELHIEKHATLPNHDKFLVQKRVQDLSGIIRIMLKLKSCQMSR